MMHIFGDHGMGMGGGGMFLMILLWVAAILGLLYLVKLLAGRTHDDARPESAEDILKKRYARGEINTEEYRKIRADLDGSS